MALAKKAVFIRSKRWKGEKRRKGEKRCSYEKKNEIENEKKKRNKNIGQGVLIRLKYEHFWAELDVLIF